MQKCLLYAPVIFFYLPELRKRFGFFAAATFVFVVGLMPYILENPSGMYHTIFGHAGLYANWGWTVWAEIWLRHPVGNRYHPAGIHGSIAIIAKYLTMAVVIGVSFWMNRKRERSLFLQLGLVSFAFMFLTPGFGDQYLSWLVPWVVALDLWPTITFYLISGLFLSVSYVCPANITACFLARLYLNLACWLSVLVVLIVYFKVVGGSDRLPLKTASRADDST